MTSSTANLAKKITKASSRQSYTTARWMVDPELENDCYRAYSYFRWVDDVVDEGCQSKGERIEFIQRQEAILLRLYRQEIPEDLTPEECILVDLIRNDRGKTSLLRSYVANFLAIIAFDARRKGRVISQQELDWYAATLGKAVTDGIQYFICNGHPYPESKNRYLAATAAHITHMLRDLKADLPEGYFNIPAEILETEPIDLNNWDDAVMRSWVKTRVDLAREYFQQGKRYLDSLEVVRCKIVGYWYCSRFETILDRIERDDYILRPYYSKPPKVYTWLKYLGLGAWIWLRHTGSYLKQHGCWTAGLPNNEVPIPDLGPD